MKSFIHSGDLGDVIYSLPTVRALGGGFMHPCDMPGVVTGHGMTHDRFLALAPLLRQQDYITAVAWHEPGPHPDRVDLNKFRSMGFDLHRQNLADNYLIANGLPTSHRDTPWLEAPKMFFESVVISRSARYHNAKFNWRNVLERFGRNAIFVGTPAEHVAFVVEFGSVPYAHTPTLLDAASIINAADLFIGNQSCPLAIAHGLGKCVIIECCLYCPNCIFNRPGEFPILGDCEIPNALSITGAETLPVCQTSRDRQGIRGSDSQGSQAAAAQGQEAHAG